MGVIQGYSATKNLELIDEFVNNNYDCAEIKCFSHKSPDICATSFRASIKRYGKSSTVQIIVKDGRVFMVKK